MRHLWKKELLVIFSLAILLIGEFSVFAVIQPEDCKDSSGNPVYCNPLGTTVNITDLTANILPYLIQITIPLAGLSIIVAGLFYVYAAASGNSSKSTQAKKIFYYVLLGSALVVGAAAIAEAVIKFIQNPT